MIGSFFCGIMSDKAGTGLSHPGVYAIAIVLGTEVVGAHYRRIVAVGAATAVAIGEARIVPESTRWLVVKERYEEADLILKRAARMNRSTIPERWSAPTHTIVQVGIARLLRDLWPISRFVNAMMYYGLTMKSDLGGGDLYINFALSASVEIVGCAFVFFFIDPVGRRIIVAGCFLIAGVCLLLNWVIGDNVAFYWGMLQIMITKGAVTASFIAVYTYTAELFPTVIRTTAVGCCSTMSRLGAKNPSCAHLFNTMVLPASTYASETSVLSKKDENAVSVVSRFERMMLGVNHLTK
ncbi:hypothetical protein ANCDUO_07703 [Ancylostoma duodenale]|uniref:Major facilitator superfamily (MFS) profile domain-containing protein n=1 Tax=Ancylostoma duodenale TaxID=51022 RepID=A0A0C2CYA8_9BILA|nr:hypothetical protein ANCDUO_07703 [Ancylostoma duodenale]